MLKTFVRKSEIREKNGFEIEDCLFGKKTGRRVLGVLKKTVKEINE